MNLLGVLPVRYASSHAKDRNQSKSNDVKPTRGAKPPDQTPKRARPNHPHIRLLGRGSGVTSFTPDRSSVRLNTALLPSTSYPRPNYLTSEQARQIPAEAFVKFRPGGYILARSVELFGSPGRMDWVAELDDKNAASLIHERVNGYLSRLEWIKPPTRALKDAAWAEHLVSMQNPNMEGELDEYEKLSARVNAPDWPSLPNSDLGLSWSSSGERDEPQTRSHRTPAYLLGNHNYPRPKRILRLRAYHPSLVLVFASPNARRAIIGAYAAWIRSKLVAAYDSQSKRESELENAPWKAVWPPIDADEIGGLRKGDADYQLVHAALNWAEKSGWRPAYRIRPFGGIRKWGDEWHLRGKWAPARKENADARRNL